MNDSIYLRLAAPLQSWAGPAITGNIVRTERMPTRTALTGLIAAALGCRRGAWPDWLKNVEFWVRQDRAPVFADDFHTINPRPEAFEFRRRLFVAIEKKPGRNGGLIFTPDAQHGTSVVNRTYLADGEFVVRVTSEDHADELEDALASPAFVTYLGRKAFAPSFPFYLGRGSSEYFDELPAVAVAESATGWADDDDAVELHRRVVDGVRYYAGGMGEQRVRSEVSQVRTREEQLRDIAEHLAIRRPKTA